MKRDQTMPVFFCIVTESVMSQYCGVNSAVGVVWNLTFREQRRVKTQECRTRGKMTVSGMKL
jgi:hypothetical protein